MTESEKNLIILSLKIPPHLKCVATLPHGMSGVTKARIENKTIVKIVKAYKKWCHFWLTLYCRAINCGRRSLARSDPPICCGTPMQWANLILPILADSPQKTGCHGNVPWRIANRIPETDHLRPHVYQSWKFGEDRSGTFGDHWSRRSTVKTCEKTQQHNCYVVLSIAGKTSWLNARFYQHWIKALISYGELDYLFIE